MVKIYFNVFTSLFCRKYTSLILLTFCAFLKNISLTNAHDDIQRSIYNSGYTLNKIHLGHIRSQKQSSSCPTQNNVGRNNVKKLDLKYSWKNLEFGFPTEAERQAAIQNNNYQPDAVIPIDIDVQYIGKASNFTIKHFKKKFH